MTDYTPWLVTRDYVRTHQKLAATETGDNAFLDQLIQEASADFIGGLLGRVPMPFEDTREYGRDKVQGRDLRIDDLLTVTTLTNADSSVISATNYNLRPDNAYPKTRIEITSASSLTWSFPYFEDRVSLAGLFGYVPQYPNQWRLPGVNIPVGGLTSSATSLVLTSGQGASFEVGQYWKCESEVGQITAIATDTLTITRAELGTTDALHTAGTAISVYKPLSDIQFAVREMVVYDYLTRHQMGARVQVFDGGVLQVMDIDPRVGTIQKRHMRKLMPLGV